ncbi:MAG: putative endonuclease 4 [Fimbriimonadales bacterium]|nr:MAG: putative endonuclease 4 [Fimbriimonadales bacterium]
MARLIGAHMPTSGGFGEAVRKGSEIGCTAVQVFTSSPQQWRAKKITDEMVEDFLAAREETGLDWMISHDSYLINLAATEEDLRKKSMEALIAEMERCSKLRIPYVVSHMGAHKGEGEEKGLKRLTKSTRSVLAETPEDVSLAMETTAGTGSSLGYRFEHLAKVLEGCGWPERLVVCLDTCHVFAAGYDIRTEEGYEAMIEEFGSLVGLERIVCIHANDSLHPFGSRKDRHAHIGEGEIGPEAFRRIVNDPRLAHAPLIVETPDAETMHEVNVRRLTEMLS